MEKVYHLIQLLHALLPSMLLKDGIFFIELRKPDEFINFNGLVNFYNALLFDFISIS